MELDICIEKKFVELDDEDFYLFFGTMMKDFGD